MTPIVRQLKSWQAREWLFSVCVAAAAVVLFAGVGLTLACLVDYFWDGFGETPFWARVLLLVLQLAAYAGFAVLAFRLVRAPSLVALAGRAEKAFTDFDHRLVTALQLNRPNARTAGMSKQLITAVTEEAIDETERRTLAALADPKRLLVAGGLLLPVLLWTGVTFAFFGPLATALLQRQALLNVEIPRSVSIENDTAPLFPAGDPVTVRLKVTSEHELADATTGTVSVTPAAGKGEQYELKNAGKQTDGSYLFTADLPPATEPFTFTARVKDGRMRTPAEVTFVARPVVTEVAAWVLAPAYVDPEGKRRYEKVAPQGEVVCHPDCSVRVRAVASKPLKSATLVLTGGKGVERRLPLAVQDEQGVGVGTATFGLPPGVNGYRVEVADEHGFANLAPPRRGISLLPDRPPTVTLNDELLMPGWETGPADDYEVRGMPLIQGGQIQIGYLARSSLGIARAAILYRVNDGPWTRFPLNRVDADEAKVGRFRQELGVFDSYDVTRNVEFYPLPSLDPDAEPGGLVAGGRYNFETSALLKTDKDGKTSKLVVGDRVEFRVAVYDRKHAAIEKVLPVALPLLDELTRLVNAKDAVTRAGTTERKALEAKLGEFAAIPLLLDVYVEAARTAVAAAIDPTLALPALRALAADLRTRPEDAQLTDADREGLRKAGPVVDALIELLAGGGGGEAARRADEFNRLPLPNTDAVRAARRLTDPAGALAAVADDLSRQSPIPMTDTDTASRPADERAGRGRPAGYSESRLKAVVTEAAFQQWREQQARSRERLREIEKLQQGVFGGGKGK